MDVARQLFAKMGVENTTMNDIALASKKGRRTLYTYFKSKEDIYLAVVESQLDILLDTMKRVADKHISPDEKMLEMNREYLGHDYYTDVITFDYDEDDIVSGDIIISLDTVKSNAELYAKSYDEELHRVIIHGILHLCGINDKGPGEREIMERAENRALAMRI